MRSAAFSASSDALVSDVSTRAGSSARGSRKYVWHSCNTPPHSTSTFVVFSCQIVGHAVSIHFLTLVHCYGATEWDTGSPLSRFSIICSMFHHLSCPLLHRVGCIPLQQPPPPLPCTSMALRTFSSSSTASGTFWRIPWSTRSMAWKWPPCRLSVLTRWLSHTNSVGGGGRRDGGCPVMSLYQKRSARGGGCARV